MKFASFLLKIRVLVYGWLPNTYLFVHVVLILIVLWAAHDKLSAVAVIAVSIMVSVIERIHRHGHTHTHTPCTDVQCRTAGGLLVFLSRCPPAQWLCVCLCSTPFILSFSLFPLQYLVGLAYSFVTDMICLGYYFSILDSATSPNGLLSSEGLAAIVACINCTWMTTCGPSVICCVALV